MFRIDESTAAAAKPTRAAVGPKPNAHFTAGATTGTKVTDDWLEAVQEEICQVIENAGITLDKEAGAAPANDDQLYSAILRLLKGTSTDIVNPFMHYAHFRHEETSGTGGGSISVGWNDRTINATAQNDITGASLAGDTITLPAGTYIIEAQASLHACGNSRLAIYDTTATAYIDYGIAAADGDTYGNTLTLRTDKFVLGVSSGLKLRQYSSAAQPTTGQGVAVGAGVTEYFADIKVYKLD